MFGTSARRLRREWKSSGRPALRQVMTFGRVLYASYLVQSEGCKAIAAARQAGFKSYWNFNRQSKKYLGYTARHHGAKAYPLIDTVQICMSRGVTLFPQRDSRR